jgi:hypothetical protein
MQSADGEYSGQARRADESPVWLVTGAAHGVGRILAEMALRYVNPGLFFPAGSTGPSNGDLNAKLRGLRELRTTRRRPVGRLRRRQRYGSSEPRTCSTEPRTISLARPPDRSGVPPWSATLKRNIDLLYYLP